MSNTPNIPIDTDTDAVRRQLIEINHDAGHHASLIADNVARHQAQDESYEPSNTLNKSYVRNMALAQISAAMVACIDAGIDLSEIRGLINLDVLLAASNLKDPEGMQRLQDDLSNIEAAIAHLDFETPDAILNEHEDNDSKQEGR